MGKADPEKLTKTCDDIRTVLHDTGRRLDQGILWISLGTLGFLANALLLARPSAGFVHVGRVRMGAVLLAIAALLVPIRYFLEEWWWGIRFWRVLREASGLTVLDEEWHELKAASSKIRAALVYTKQRWFLLPLTAIDLVLMVCGEFFVLSFSLANVV